MDTTKSRPRFKLCKDFVEEFSALKPPFGFNGLGEIVYTRTYARIKPNGKKEQWFETVERVVNGTFTMQKAWMAEQQLDWDEAAAEAQAKEMYRRIFQMKFLPPGRGLWAMGTALTEERGLYAALNNCAFVSTAGFAADAHGYILTIATRILHSREHEYFVVPDSREGWVESVKVILDAFFLGRPLPSFDYSQVRPAGMPIRGFGGKTMGPGPLRELHGAAAAALRANAGRPLSVTTIVDLQNLIGKSRGGGASSAPRRRSPGDPSGEVVDLKDFEKNPAGRPGGPPTTSVFAELGMDYAAVCERVRRNGEPGFAWLENMRRYGRMNGAPDHKARGGGHF
ncbi:unnamed protein product [Heterosigma akashiwo]